MARGLLLVYGLAVIALALAWVRTGRRPYLSAAGWMLGGGAAAALVFFGVLIAERW